MRFHRESRCESYDAIVIGAGLGGLSTAALLARRGMHVLVVERHDRPGGYAHSFRRRRYLFDSSVHLIGGCGPGASEHAGLIDRVLRSLGVRDRCDFERADPFYSAIFPDFRLDVPSGIDGFIDAHVEAFPEQQKGFRELVQVCRDIRAETLRAPALGSLGEFVRHAKHLPTLVRYHDATLAEVMREHVDDPRLASVFGTLWPYLGLPPSRVSFLYWAMMLMSYVEDGAWYCRGSFQRLAEAFAESLDASGGELLLKSGVRRIEIKDGFARGVVLENGQRIEAPIVISAADARQTFDELVGREHLPRRFVRELRGMRQSLSAFVVYGATDLDLRAHGATHEMFAYRTWDHDEDYANLLAGRISRIGFTAPSLADPSLAPEGEQIFTLTVLLPFEVVDSWRSEKERYTELLLDEANALFPGLRDHVRFAEGGSPRTLERYTLNHAGAMYGWDVSPDQVGPLRLAHETPIQGLSLAGHWTQPGGGVYGVISSGVSAAQRVLGLPDARSLFEGAG